MDTFLRRAGSAVAMVALLVVGYFYLASGLVAPTWAVVLLVAFWIVLFWLAVRWFNSHPVRVLLLPLVAIAVWVLVIAAGGALLGWTA